MSMYSLDDDPSRRRICLRTAMDIRSFVYTLSESKNSMPVHLRDEYDQNLSELKEIIRKDSILLIGLCSTVGGPLTRDPLFPKGWKSIRDSYAHICGVYSGYRSDSDPGYHRD